MAKHLIIKTSSLGDIVHMLPALTDASRMISSFSADWVAEQGFAEVPAWHPNIRRVIPCRIRHWRKNLFRQQTWQEMAAFRTLLQQSQYRQVIDSQGLLKSAVLTRLSRGQRWGYDRHSIREPAASFFYQQKAAVPFQEHAVTRNRLLLAQALGYSIAELPLDYGIADNHVFKQTLKSLRQQQQTWPPEKYMVALHGTSKKDKEWPLPAWEQFLAALENRGYSILFPQGNAAEAERAKYLEQKYHVAQMLPNCSLTQLASLIKYSAAVIGMDTGLMHIAAAFDKKGIALYPATKPELTGVLNSSHSIISMGGQAALNTADIVTKMLKWLP